VTIHLNSIGAITLFVEDPARSKVWYKRAFDLPIVFEDDDSAVFKFDNTLINLLRVSAAHDLIAPAAVGTTNAGARLQLTIWVEDADAVVAELHRRGVELLNGPLDRAWGQRTACFSDPDGHVWELAQTIS
jgi:catechol 2,3-dioxygenase-like lactoylglutathione lyase family enzyme